MLWGLVSWKPYDPDGWDPAVQAVLKVVSGRGAVYREYKPRAVQAYFGFFFKMYLLVQNWSKNAK